MNLKFAARAAESLCCAAEVVNLAGLAGNQNRDSFSGVPIPQRRHGSNLRISGEDSGKLGSQLVRIASHQNVGS